MNPANCNNDLQNGADNPAYLMSRSGISKYNLKAAVKLPEGESREEWIAYKIYEFHKQICMLYGTITNYCTPDTCPKMTAGKHQYLWSSEPENRPVELCAREYIHHLLDWTQEQLNDGDIFPSQHNKKFPEDFIDVCKTIAKRLFRVYAHVYHHHLMHVKELKIEGHMHTSLKHFIHFAHEFQLIAREEEDPLDEYIMS